MGRLVRYLSHPQVVIDPDKDVRDWSLSPQGAAGVRALAGSKALSHTRAIISSAEVKALETAKPLATTLSLTVQVREQMHENDRTTTGFLPPAEFEAVADLFFASLNTSIRGWESAADAQTRVVDEVHEALSATPNGDILFVRHGAMGTLFYYHFCGVPISRALDQGPGGGGNYQEFCTGAEAQITPWRPMEALAEP